MGTWPVCGRPVGLTHRELSRKGPSCSQGLGDLPALLQTGRNGEGTEGEGYSQRHSCLLTSLGKAVSGLGLG